jgi:hypothetical protein
MGDVAAADCGPLGEAVVFLSYFKDSQDPRQRGKVTYPLGEVLLQCLLAVLADAETFVDIACFAPGSSHFSVAYARFAMGGRHTITSAISLPRSMPSNSSAASLHGWPG